jgi:tRNA modification GTPase
VPSCEKTVYFQTKTANDPLESLIKEVSALLRRQPDYGMLPNTALRCRESLIAAGESLNRAQQLTDASLIALEIRGAVNQLGLIDGTVHTEDILDNIFSRFCIGK